MFPLNITKDLRKITGTPNFSKVFEIFPTEVMIEDMKRNRVPSKYRNTKGVSTQHYLIKDGGDIQVFVDSRVGAD